MSSNPDMASKPGYDSNGHPVKAIEGTANPAMANKPGYDANGFIVIASAGDGTASPDMADKNGYDDEGSVLVALSGEANPDMADKPGYDSNGHVVTAKSGTANPAMANKPGYDANGYPVGGDMPAAFLPLQKSASVARMTGAYTFDRNDSDATVTDNYGITHQVSAYEVRFDKARRVHNELPNTLIDKDSWDTAIAVDEGAVLAPDGTMTARRFTRDSGTLLILQKSASTNSVVDRTGLSSIWIRGVCPTLNMYQASGNQLGITITEEWRQYAAPYTYLTSLQRTTGVASVAAAASDWVEVWNPQLEDVTGRPTTAPSEFVSVREGTGPEIGADAMLATATWSDPDVTSDGTQIHIGNSAGTVSWNETPATVANRYYVVEFDVVGTPSLSLLIPVIGGTAATEAQVFGAGHYKGVVKASSAGGIAWSSIATDVDIENFSVKEIDHGANVDAVKYFDTENWDSVTDNVVTERAGPQLRQRVAENVLAGSSDDLTNAEWTTQFSATVAFNGEYSTMSMGASAFSGISNSAPSVVGDYTNSVIMWVDSGTHDVRIWIDNSVSLTATLTTTPKRFSLTGASTGGSAAFAITNLIATVGDIHVKNCQSEDVTDLTNQNPSEYISVGVATGGEELTSAIKTAMFDADTSDWTLFPAEFSVSTNELITINSIASVSIAEYPLPNLVVGGKYLVSFDLAESGATTLVSLSDYTVDAIVGAGPIHYEGVLVADADKHLQVVGNFVISQISNLSIKRVDHGYFDNTTGEYLDGYKGFNTTNANTVVSDVVTEAVGDPIKPVDGVLIESLTQNLLRRTESILTANTDWLTYQADSVASSNFIAGYPAFEVSSITAASATYHEIYNADGVTIANGSYCTLSCNFAKLTGSGDFGYIRFTDSVGTAWSGASINLSTGEVTEWADALSALDIVVGSAFSEVVQGGYRLHLTVLAVSGATTRYFDVGFSDNATSGSQTGTAYTNGESLGFINNPQASVLTYPTSYIENDGGTTDKQRNADVLEYDDNINDAAGSIYLECTTQGLASGSAHAIIGAVTGSVPFYALMAINAARNFQIVDNTDVATSTKQMVDRQLHKCCATWDEAAGELKVCVDGETPVTVTGWNGWGGVVNKITTHPTIASGGNVDNLRVFNKVLSGAKMQELTS